jgi:hypothetical protein
MKGGPRKPDAERVQRRLDRSHALRVGIIVNRKRSIPARHPGALRLGADAKDLR